MIRNITTRTLLTVAAMLLASGAFAQTTPGNPVPGATSSAPMPGVGSGTSSGVGIVDRTTGAAAASGDRNQAVATTAANAPQPARGSNSFTQAEARRRMERAGFSGIGTLTKDGGVWRGTATKAGQPAQVWLDYKGNVGQGSAVTSR